MVVVGSEKVEVLLVIYLLVGVLMVELEELVVSETKEVMVMEVVV